MVPSYVPFTTVLMQLPGSSIVLEPRSKHWKFGCLNYGEVCPPWYNAADGDKWDIVAPGYRTELPVRTPFVVDRVLGVLMLDNDNHKIAVRLRNVNGYDGRRASREMKQYCHEYTRRMRLRGRYLQCSEGPDGTLYLR